MKNKEKEKRNKEKKERKEFGSQYLSPSKRERRSGSSPIPPKCELIIPTYAVEKDSFSKCPTSRDTTASESPDRQLLKRSALVQFIFSIQKLRIKFLNLFLGPKKLSLINLLL